jgi:3-oxoacyl-[acyl-carrier protein] reductase
MHLLKKKYAVITGGTAGIGRGIALKFAEEGASVAIFGTNKERGEAVIEEMKKVQPYEDQTFLFFQNDVSDKQAVDAAIAELLSKWPTCDILVNNAGITRDGLLMRMKEADFDDVIRINLKSVYNLCQSLIKPMVKARSGKIINIASVVGIIGNAGQINYAASKAGMIGMTKSLAHEVASRNICVNCIAPGFIKTQMTDKLSDAQKEGLFQRIPLGRFGEPEAIANAALFFASSLSDYVTGQVLAVDGGMIA